MTICVFCKKTINTRKKVFCRECKNTSHTACVHKTADIASLLSDIRGLSWKCNDCVSRCISLDKEAVVKMVNDQIQNALSTFTTSFESLKDDLIQLVLNKCGQTQQKSAPEVAVSYSKVVRNNTQPAVLITPKNQQQTNTQTKQDIAENIDPAVTQLKISKVKAVNNGGLLIGCKNHEENVRFKQLAEQKLADSYDIKELRGINPRVRIVGFTDTYNEEDLLSIIKKLNGDIFCDDSTCEIVKISKTKKILTFFRPLCS